MPMHCLNTRSLFTQHMQSSNYLNESVGAQWKGSDNSIEEKIYDVCIVTEGSQATREPGSRRCVMNGTYVGG